MKKNIYVISESGTVIGKTFSKRAKGLVKKGRARFINEYTICLACSPEKTDSEEQINMNNNIYRETDTSDIQDKDSIITEKDFEQSESAVLSSVKEASEENAENKADIEEATVETDAPETKEKIRLEVYKNGMEVWSSQVQILLMPQYENGRNVTSLYSTGIEFHIKISDSYDRVKEIRLHPSTFFNAGVKRGLSLIRFTPCLSFDENQWIPVQNESYWISFTAKGTDGIVYESDEAEIILRSCPVINGKLCVRKDMEYQGGRSDGQFQGNTAVFDHEISDLKAEIDDLRSEIENCIDDLMDTKSDMLTVSSVLDRIKASEDSLSEQLTAVITLLEKPLDGCEDYNTCYSGYCEMVVSVTETIEKRHQLTVEIYKAILEKLMQGESL